MVVVVVLVVVSRLGVGGGGAIGVCGGRGLVSGGDIGCGSFGVGQSCQTCHCSCSCLGLRRYRYR